MSLPPSDQPHTSLSTHLAEETLHQTRWLRLKKLSYMDESQVKREWDCVERTTRSGEIDGVDIIATMIPLEETEKHVVLISQYRPPMRAYCIEFPAGLCDSGESAEQAAERELLEETGLKICKISRVSSIVGLEVGMTNANCRIVCCEVEPIKISERPKQQLEDEEHITIHLVKLSKLFDVLEEMTKNHGFIIDAKVWTYAFGISNIH
ncbi:hypothetical protein FDP41_006583 [Naegleria fowleri]|uniref:Nudix hydrolase domain-containing protein n=1 Tax=Naegleria fowleri TaxID=5763 RepID=A0A6A5BJG5_NAEFO|nr:uncharacterized protein FDP41_006583 [Naegleria fowleri]KAF0974551.1 hypothetical protein FDP41_006583 [Naegleria fowleri]CAG4718288.1 unnamed protein product [Naegleria fowleri]